MKIRDSYLIFGQPPIEEAEIDEVVKSMRAAWLGTGPKVAAFEKKIAEYKKVNHAVAVGSCTAALHLSMMALDIGPGDEVITTPLTFCATVNAIIHTGATPVLADIDPVTQNIDPAEVEKKITGRTKAILPVHFAGRPCDMNALLGIARKHGLKLVEDCAHAIETLCDGRPAGSFGEAGTLSFYATKNIVTGEGGMILTDNEAIASRAKMLALHGMSKDAWKRFSDDGYQHYDVVEIGYKCNMMDLQAAIGLHQMDRVDRYWDRRLEIWNHYQEAFASLPIEIPSPIEQAPSRHALHLYTIGVDAERCGLSRDKVMTQLHQMNIGTGVHYRSIPVHPVYQKRYGWKPEDYPHALAIGNKTISLPISPRLTDGDVADVIAALKRVIENAV